MSTDTTTVDRETTTLLHGRARLALHRLRPGDGRPLLFLHGLGESSPTAVPAYLSHWPGPVHALDLTGHGESSRPLGGGYTAEILMADVDAALNHLGSATLFGRGLGAYLALLTAGARPDAVRGVILADGPGLVGGGIRPTSPFLPAPHLDGQPGPDPYVLLEMSRDVRPPDYVVEYVQLLVGATDLDTPLSVCTIVRPEWLTAVIEEGGDRVADCSLDDALDRYAALP